MEYLEGGRVGKIGRIGDRVHRPSGEWTPYVHALLKYIRAQGFYSAPEVFGYDVDGNEVISYIVGEVSNYHLSQTAMSTNVLISSAKLLRAYHEASVGFVNALAGNEHWFLPVREPVEVMCHGDFAPYNVVLDGEQAIAMIDFDTVHPGPRVWDIAYALYRFAPLTDPKNWDGFGSVEEKIRRCRLFCDSYGLPKECRAGLIELVIERLRAMVNLMQAGADAGHEAFQANIADGHHLLYFGDIEFLRVNCDRFQAGL